MLVFSSLKKIWLLPPGASDVKIHETWGVLVTLSSALRPPAGGWKVLKTLRPKRPNNIIANTTILTTRGCMLPSSPKDETWTCEKCGKGKPAAQVKGTMSQWHNVTMSQCHNVSGECKSILFKVYVMDNHQELVTMKLRYSPNYRLTRWFFN